MWMGGEKRQPWCVAEAVKNSGKSSFKTVEWERVKHTVWKKNKKIAASILLFRNVTDFRANSRSKSSTAIHPSWHTCRCSRVYSLCAALKKEMLKTRFDHEWQRMLEHKEPMAVNQEVTDGVNDCWETAQLCIGSQVQSFEKRMYRIHVMRTHLSCNSPAPAKSHYRHNRSSRPLNERAPACFEICEKSTN